MGQHISFVIGSRRAVHKCRHLLGCSEVLLVAVMYPRQGSEVWEIECFVNSVLYKYHYLLVPGLTYPLLVWAMT